MSNNYQNLCIVKQGGNNIILDIDCGRRLPENFLNDMVYWIFGVKMLGDSLQGVCFSNFSNYTNSNSIKSKIIYQN